MYGPVIYTTMQFDKPWTLESYLKAVNKLLDSGLSQVTNFQLILLKGSELERLDSRRTFKFDTRFRIGPKNFGLYDGEIVFDVEEVVVATDTLSFDDYLRVRQVALICLLHRSDEEFAPKTPLLEEIASIDVANYKGRKQPRAPHIIFNTKGDTQIWWGAEIGEWAKRPQTPAATPGTRT